MRKALVAAGGVVLVATVVLGVAARRESFGKPTLALRVVDLPTPAPAGSRLPNALTGFGGEQLALSWVETGPTKDSTLRFAILRDGKWSASKAVLTSVKFNPHPSVLPAVAVLGDGSLVAEWTQLLNSDPNHFSEDVYAAASKDLGLTWTAPVRVNRDNTQSEHSLVSIVAGEKQADLIWLDGRESEKTGEYAFLHASMDDLGKVSPETILDARVCSCCPTAITTTPNGLAVAYRDRTQDEIRDISVVHSVDGRWLKPTALHRDGWHINGCPNNGPALASGKGRIAAGWYTAANDQPHVKVAFSKDRNGDFGTPVVVDEGSPAGRAAIAMMTSGDAIVTWVERRPDSTRLLARRVNVTGRAGPAIEVAPGSARDLGFPRIAVAGNVALVTWTASGETQRIHTARLEAAE